MVEYAHNIYILLYCVHWVRLVVVGGAPILLTKSNQLCFYIMEVVVHLFK
jgi:hypothetical protein